MYKILIAAFFAVLGLNAYSQVSGFVKDPVGNTLVGATIYWEGTYKGSTTNEDGYFTIANSKGNKTLVISSYNFV